MSRLTMAFIGIALLLVSAVTSFSVLLLFYNPGTEAADVPEVRSGGEDVTLMSDAESKAGYSIASPTSLPTSFVKNDIIMGNKLASDHFQVNIVQQFWKSSADPSIQFDLEQHPGLAGLTNSEPTTINGVSGERKLLPASPPGRPHPTLSLFWKDGDTAFVLSGTLAGTLTEAALLEIAGSVSLPEDTSSGGVR